MAELAGEYGPAVQQCSVTPGWAQPGAHGAARSDCIIYVGTESPAPLVPSVVELTVVRPGGRRICVAVPPSQINRLARQLQQAAAELEGRLPPPGERCSVCGLAWVDSAAGQTQLFPTVERRGDRDTCAGCLNG